MAKDGPAKRHGPAFMPDIVYVDLAGERGRKTIDVCGWSISRPTEAYPVVKLEVQLLNIAHQFRREFASNDSDKIVFDWAATIETCA